MIRNIVVATTEDGGIGVDGRLPWKNKDDMQRFVSLTKGQAVVMGRKTYESIGHPLKNRLNIILTSDRDYKPQGLSENGVIPTIATNIEEAEAAAESAGYKDEIFYIGGAKVFEYLMERDMADTIYLSIIKDCEEKKLDTYFPMFDKLRTARYVTRWAGNGDGCSFYNVFRKRHESHCDVQYLDLLRDIIENGVDTPTRVGTARSLFDAHLHFDLRKGLPVLTTKKMAMKAVIVELLWFFQGCKNIKYLNDRNVHIWDKDAYAYYLKLAEKHGVTEPLGFEGFMKYVDARGSMNWEDGTYTFGDVGPIYGSQWTDFDHSGIDQLKEVVNKLKTDPFNRRLIVTAWNPKRIPEMALPPCHYAMEFYTEPIPINDRIDYFNKNVGGEIGGRSIVDVLDEHDVPKYYLSMRWIQRSCDMALGVPFNILSYAIMLTVIAKTVNMLPKMLAGSLGNAHIYTSHIDGVKRMLDRNPYLFDAAHITVTEALGLPEPIGGYDRLAKLEPNDIRITDYESYPTIKFDLFTDASKQV